MSSSLQHLLPLYERELSQSHPMVLATVIRTAGPSYTKPGAQMLITQSGEYAGLLSGGCLEGDLSERAARVLRTRNSELASYDMRGPDDLLFGLGSGCEGAMDILLQRLDALCDWQPMKRLIASWKSRRRETLLLVVPPLEPDVGQPSPSHAHGHLATEAASTVQDRPPIGAGIFIDDRAVFGAHGAALEALSALAAAVPPGLGSHVLPRSSEGAGGPDLFLLEQGIQPRILLLGAGADALPVSKLALFLGWSVTVVDHRSYYAQAARFPGAEAVVEGGAAAVSRLLHEAPSAAGHFDAAIVMSHHLLTDAAYLHALVLSNLPYIGLLGPIVRRERLLAELGPEAARLRGRLHAPVGLDLGASSPEAIALSIVAEIQAVLSGSATCAPLSTKSAASAAVSAAGLAERS